jgi:hypothetical protein
MPILSLDGIKRMTELSAAHLPEGLHEQLEARRGNDEAVAELGVAYATLQCADLLRGGAPGIHFITLNRSPATRAILSALAAHAALALNDLPLLPLTLLLCALLPVGAAHAVVGGVRTPPGRPRGSWPSSTPRRAGGRSPQGSSARRRSSGPTPS